jgi:hypothetical protein
MAMTRKDFRRWTEDPTLKGKRERQRRRRKQLLRLRNCLEEPFMIMPQAEHKG